MKRILCVSAVAALVVCAAGSAHPAGGAFSVVLQPNGKIVVGGWGERGGQISFGLARYSPGGKLDPNFGLRGKAITPLAKRSEAAGIALQPDGKVVAAGFAGGDFGNTFKFAVARYTPQGRLDAAFGKNGRVTTKFDPAGSYANAVALQPDGKILAVGGVGPGGAFAVARYTRDGKLDPGFGSGGKVLTTLDLNRDVLAGAVAVQPDGKIVVAGVSGNDVALVRYDAAGRLDPTFGSGGIVKTYLGNPAGADALALQPDGKIVVAGDVETDPVGPGYDFALVRYLPDGSLDPSFGSNGIVTTPFGNVAAADLPYGGAASAVALQPDGKIVAGGAEFVPWPGRGAFAVARYLPDGTLDQGFGSGGKVTTSFGYTAPENVTEDGDVATGLAIQPDGKTVAAGFSQFGPHTEQYSVALARYLDNGSLDPAFGSAGEVKTSLAICVVPKLRGQKMDWFAQQRIKGSHCAVGKIKRVHSRTVRRRRIISERPRPGSVHVEGTKVKIVVSLGRR